MLERAHGLDRFAPPLSAVDGLPVGELPAAAIHVAALMARIAARMAEVRGLPTVHEADQERMLDIREAAAELGVSTKWLYTNHRGLGFTRRVGRHLRFSRRGLLRYRDRVLGGED